jgi:adiponectin receptor
VAHLGAVEGARRRIIDLVHALLPSEDWAGWERLGWEETAFVTSDGGTRPAHGRSASSGLDRIRAAVEEEEDEEPEYLFPNRTPGSVMALEARRRTIRSRSLGAYEAERWGKLPMLERVRTEPSRAASARGFGLEEDGRAGEELKEGDDDEETLLGEAEGEEAVDILAHPDLADRKLTKLVAPSHLGPSVLEALTRSDDGRRLICFEDLPFHWRNNEHVITG